MNKLRKALYMLGTVMLSTVGMGQSPGALSVQNVSPTVIEENTPLYLEHATVINQQSAQQKVQLSWHESHHSHYSHESHDSHYSHRSHHSGY